MTRHIFAGFLALLIAGLMAASSSPAAQRQNAPATPKATQSNPAKAIPASRVRRIGFPGGYGVPIGPIGGGGGGTGVPGVAGQPDSFTFDQNGVMVMNGTKKIFPIGITIAPPPDSTTPTGKNAYQELSDGGVMFMRTGINTSWDSDGLAMEKSYEDAAAAHGLHCQLNLRDLSKSYTPATDAILTNVINTFKDHPGLGEWKGADEPFWGNISPTICEHVYNLIHRLDPTHPVWIVQAPRGTSSDLAPYDSGCDFTGVDIYPIGYPPGKHSLLSNKEISMVGDWTDTIAAATRKPYMITLQVAWSGVVPTRGKRLRFPTFPQERFMAYQAIIHGARGLQFFGGTIASTLNARDSQYGYNWTFWNSVLKPLLAEIGPHGPLVDALTAPDSNAPITVDNGIEFIVRQTNGGNDLYIIACKREGDTVQATFSGIPAGFHQGEVMFEDPVTVTVGDDGTFSDWFAPFDVHVYHFQKS